MYTVLIADDEFTIRNGLKKFIENNRPELKICGIFKDGQQVIDYIRTTSADIIITDINMPVADGLSIAKYVFEKKLDTKVILISGYQEFEYAKRAIDYHVNCLLVKPFLTSQLITAISSAENEIEDMVKQSLTNSQNCVMKWSDLRNSLILLLKSENLYDSEFSTNQTIKELCENYICTEVTLLCDLHDTSMLQKIRDLSEIDNGDAKVFLITDRFDNITALLFTRNRTDIDTHINEIIKSVRLFVSENINCSKMEFDNLKCYYEYKQMYLKAKEYVAALEKSSQETFSKLSHDYTERQLKLFVGCLLKEVKDKADIGISIDAESDLTGREECLTAVRLIKEEYLKSLSKNKHFITGIKKYIDENFSGDLCVETIAENFGVTPTHTGRVFKNETGQKLVDYIIKVRVEKAKELLLDRKLDFMQISMLVGYSNARYFNMIFKKSTGQSLTEYRKSHIR